MGAKRGSSEHNLQRSVCLQLTWTILGTVILLVVVAIMGTIWGVNYIDTHYALASVATHFRKEQAQQLSLELAALIHPCWEIARRFVDNQRSGIEIRDVAALPMTGVSFGNMTRVNSLATYLAPSTLRETHLRSVNPDGTGRVLTFFLGVVLALGFDDAGNPTSDISQCSRVVFSSNVLSSEDAESNDHLVDRQYLNATAPDGMSRALYRWDNELQTIAEEIVPNMPTLPCAVAMSPLWLGRPNSNFQNFTWFGPYNPGIGWGNHLEGNVPVYSPDGRQVGRMGSVVSMGKSVSPMLKRVLADSGEIGVGGHAAVYTASGTVIGLSEDAATPSTNTEQAETVEKIVPGSYTGRAIASIRSKYGTVCPTTQVFSSSDDRDQLVDVTPFRSEEYGLPPFDDRWCQLMVMPRANVFAPIDKAAQSGIAVAVTAAVGIVGAVLLLGRSVFVARGAQVRMNNERLALQFNRCRKALEFLKTFSQPMALMSTENFLQLKQLVHFEECRDRGWLMYLDSYDLVQPFKEAGNLILFISHQWLGWSFPDNEEGRQLRAMQMAAQSIAKTEVQVQCHVWVDYISVAQRHPTNLRLAVSSLPAYVAVADRFVIIAPTASHRDSGHLCDLQTYARRGWCRLEVLSKACSTGLDGAFFCHEDSDKLMPFTEGELGKVPLNPFTGDYAVRSDMESLVEPVLGLWSLILRQKGHAHMDKLRNFVEKDKAAFFPHKYCPDPDAPDEVVPLFEDLVRLMEDRLTEMEEGRMSDPEAIISV